ncbi:hypothetical protein ACFU7X_00960 [Streptomyces chartreusis]|uniref:hypothetical protein n=1 Tax=Streptomyces chartreusis TaxID=1969 RepID=UPI0036A92A6F
MTSDHEGLWHRCALLGHILLPLVDQEPWRRTRRHERLRSWGIDRATGELLIEQFASLAARAVAVEASLSVDEFDALPLVSVADAAIGKRDIELLAGLPHRPFADDGIAVGLFRLYAYKGGQYSRRLFQLSREVRHTLVVLTEHRLTPSVTCGDAFRRAAEAGLAQ